MSHSRAGHTAELASSILAAAEETASPGSEIRLLDAFVAGPEDVLTSSGVILGTPARFGYMSGAMKDFLERVYHPCIDHTAGLPWALFVKGDTDTSGAVASVERIVAGLRWRRVLPILEVVGPVTAGTVEAARELGAAFAAGLEAGIF
ncbi:MAG: flavodoxin family protein [Acidimicrobiales bacterium]